jgi:hypothetical protein
MAARRFLIALLVLAACSNDKTQPPPPQPDAAPPGQTSPTIKFGVNEADALSNNPQPQSFDLLSLRELWFAYSVPNIGDVAVMRIKTIMPNGLPYGTYVTAYSLDQPNHMQVNVPGFSVPIDVRPASQNGGAVTMTYGIPISGTDYQRHPYPGTWRVHVSIDGVAGSDVDASIVFKVGQ